MTRMNPLKEIRIKIEEDIPDDIAIETVAQVIKQGKISTNGKGEKKYCWVTTFNNNITVSVRDYRKSTMFYVYKSK